MPLEMATWTVGYAVVIYFMWWIMMIAMMLPSASTTILLFSRAHHKKNRNCKKLLTLNSVCFRLSDSLGWFQCSCNWGAVVFRRCQFTKQDDGNNLTHIWRWAILVAGLWQFTPWKYACLRHCRSPLTFLMTRWRPGLTGAFIMGMDHGAFCLGCCWFLMALLLGYFI